MRRFRSVTPDAMSEKMTMAGSSNPHSLSDELGRNLTFGLLDAVGRAVVLGEYEGRAFPTEADLALQYGVSRSVTREAVKMLAAKGLLGSRPKQGTFVQPPNQWNLFDADILRWLLDRKFSVALLRQFNELRIGIEPQAAAIAASCARPVQLAAIASGLERMRRAEQGHDDALDADIAFHVAILRASGNPFYIQLRDIVSTALRTSIHFTNRIAGRTANVDDHAAVYTAISRGDGVSASLAMRKLIEDVIHVIDSSSDPAM